MSRRVRMCNCARCGRFRRREGRGMCSACYGWARYHGRLDDYPKVGTPLDLIAEEAFHPSRPREARLPGDRSGPYQSAAGRQFVRTAQELGLTEKAARRAYYRARERGLLQEAS